MATSRTGTQQWKSLRARVIREEHTCHLCRLPVDKSLPVTDPMHATVDHLVPWSLGGQDTRQNVALSHSLCNKRRQAKALDATNGTGCPAEIHQSRQWLSDYTACPQGLGWHSR